MEDFEENWEESCLKQIGAKVPGEFAKKFSEYCTKKKFNQRKLFFYLAKWWYEQDETNQWHISRGRIKQVLPIIMANHADVDALNDENAAAHADIKPKHKQKKRTSAKSV